MTPGTNVSRLTEMNLHPIAIAGIGGLGKHSAPSGWPVMKTPEFYHSSSPPVESARAYDALVAFGFVVFPKTYRGLRNFNV